MELAVEINADILLNSEQYHKPEINAWFVDKTSKPAIVVKINLRSARCKVLVSGVFNKHQYIEYSVRRESSRGESGQTLKLSKGDGRRVKRAVKIMVAACNAAVPQRRNGRT